MANDTQIVIGKRIQFGMIVGGVVSFGVWLWNLKNPDAQIPAEQAIGITTVVTGLGQVIICNLFGVTTPVEKE